MRERVMAWVREFPVWFWFLAGAVAICAFTAGVLTLMGPRLPLLGAEMEPAGTTSRATAHASSSAVGRQQGGGSTGSGLTGTDQAGERADAGGSQKEADGGPPSSARTVPGESQSPAGSDGAQPSDEPSADPDASLVPSTGISTTPSESPGGLVESTLDGVLGLVLGSDDATGTDGP